MKKKVYKSSIKTQDLCSVSLRTARCHWQQEEGEIQCDWLHVVPSPALGLHVRSAEFVISVRYWLGCPVFSSSGQCPACSRHSDRMGDHAISCGSDSERIARHNHLRDALPHCCQCQSGSCQVRHCPGRNSCQPLQSALVSQAAATSGPPMSHSYNRKMQGTAESRVGLVFIPVPLETLGGFHNTSVAQVKKLGAALGRQTNQNEAETTRHYSSASQSYNSSREFIAIYFMPILKNKSEQVCDCRHFNSFSWGA